MITTYIAGNTITCHLETCILYPNNLQKWIDYYVLPLDITITSIKWIMIWVSAATCTRVYKHQG